MNCSLRIKEVKEISVLVSEKYNIDINSFTYVSLKIKIEQFCVDYKISSASALIEKLKISTNLLNELVAFIFINEFELFRDPALWRSIRDEVLSTFTRDIQYKVWFPSCFEGGELISFLILRDELKLTNRIKVIYTTPLEELNRVKEGFVYEERKHNINLSNYKRIEGHELPEKYFVKQANIIKPLEELFENTVHEEFCEARDGAYKKNVNLIVYRNKLLNFNRKQQVDIVDNLIDSLKTGGFLALGVKEVLVDDANREKFIIFNKKESLYKKH